MTSHIYCKYKNLSASILAEEQFAKAKEVFELTVKGIQANLKIAEEKFVKERDEIRAKAKWYYFMSDPKSNNGYYYIYRVVEGTPVLGDEEFYKDREYCKFRIVNNVFIQEGNGLYFTNTKTGDIITDDELNQLNDLIVPKRFQE